jgi:Helicase associated domain
MPLSTSAPSSPNTRASITGEDSFHGSPTLLRHHLRRHHHDDDDDDDNISAPASPIYPTLPDHDDGDGDNSVGHQQDGHSVSRMDEATKKSRNQNTEQDDATVALNEADRSFLETFHEEENMSRDDEEVDVDENNDEEDGDAMRYDRPMWQQVLDLDNDPQDQEDDEDNGAFGAGGARGLMIGPLLPPPENAANIATNAMLGPSLLGPNPPSRGTERSTLHEFADLTALARELENPQLHQGVSFTEGAGEIQHQISLTGAETGFPIVPKTRDVFLEGRTPPRKRKFDLILNNNGDVDSIMLDNFKPPSRTTGQTDQHSNDPAALNVLHPLTPSLSRRSVSKYDTDQTSLGLLRDREAAETIDATDFSTFMLHDKEPRHQTYQKTLGMDQTIMDTKQQAQPQSMARKRWNFVVSEQSKVKQTLEKAQVDFAQAQKILKEAQDQFKSVNDAVQKTCQECYSFLIQEDKEWYEGYCLLQDYRTKFGNTLVPRNFQNIKKFASSQDIGSSVSDICSYEKLSKLGRWVGAQRKSFKKGGLEKFKVYALNQLGFDFDPAETRWKSQYQLLVKFVQENGHARVPYNYGAKSDKKEASTDSDPSVDSDDAPLGAWIKRQQHQYKRFQEGNRTELTLERIRLLNDVGMVWNRREASWMDHMKELQQFKSIHGHINIQSKDNAGLGEWLRDQRAKYNDYLMNPLESPLSDNQIELLQEVGIENSGRNESKWRERIDELLEFRNYHGHCLVPKHYPKNQPLASWCDRQREQYQCHLRGQSTVLTQDRINELRSIGFEFQSGLDQVQHTELLGKTWDDFFTELAVFRKENGNAKVPSTTRLGQWLEDQRNLLQKHREGVRVNLSAEQIEKLSAMLSFPKSKMNTEDTVTSVEGKSWESWFGDLLAHRIHAKTFRLPQTEAFFGLRNWVEEQRREYARFSQGLPSKLTYDKVLQLQRAKFPFNVQAKTVNWRKLKVVKSWEEQYADLLQYRLLHDSFEVPKEYSDLHNWTVIQRERYHQLLENGHDSMPSHVVERLNKLERVGFPFHKSDRTTPLSNERIDTVNLKARETIWQVGMVRPFAPLT